MITASRLITGLFTLFLVTCGVTAQAQSANWFMRAEGGFQTQDLSFAEKTPYLGLNYGLTFPVRNTGLQLGGSFSWVPLAHRDWTAPFASGVVYQPAAFYCSQANGITGELLLRYESPAGRRLIPYLEGGTGVSLLCSDLYVYAEDPAVVDEPLELQHTIIQRTPGLSASAGAGLLVKLFTLDRCSEQCWSDLYLDLYAGGRRATGIWTFYAGEGQAQSQPFQQMFVRLGLNFKVSHPNRCTQASCCD